MTLLQYAATRERLRVSTDGQSREFDEHEVRLGPLALQRTASGWSVRDVGETPMLYLDGCRVVQLPLFRGRPIAVHVGAPDGQLVELEVLEPMASVTETVFRSEDFVDEWIEPEPERASAYVPPAAYVAPARVFETYVPPQPEAVAELELELELEPEPLAHLEPAQEMSASDSVLVQISAPAAPEICTNTQAGRDAPSVGEKGNNTESAADTPAPAPTRPPTPARTPGPTAVPAVRRTSVPAVVTPEPGALIVDRVSVTTGNGHRLLDNISFALAPGSLTAVIGPSGSGKSTLLRALTGEAPATTGRVVWDGHDLDSERDRVRFRIGVVPQDDLLHRQLTVEQGLRYAAALRLPPDTTHSEREARVDEVLDQLGLTSQRRQRIGSQLSGGQRKRVSIATELITAPSLLFLDEPTSGLDPGFDRSVMEQLRGLSREERIVVVVTHSVLGLEACDNVVVLARGGSVCYVGPPEGVLDHFGCAAYPELFDLLESGTVPPRPSTASVPRPSLRPPGTLSVPPRQSPPMQLATLVRRCLAVTLADRLTLAMLVLMPLLLAALSRVVPGEGGLSLVAARAAGATRMNLGQEAGQRLTLLLVAATLMGAAMAIRELVKERAVVRREYAVGLSPGAYVLAKALVLGALCFGQGLLVTWLALAGLPGLDADGVRGHGLWEIALVTGLLTVASAFLGLLASALVQSVEQAMPALVALVMGQLVLSSALVQVAGRPVLEQIAWLAPARWAHAANAVSVHLERAKNGVPGAVPDPLAAYTTGQWDRDLMVLVAIATVLLLLTLRAVRRSLRA
ncbi:ATP-binding cassette domain-containing protein [Nocardioides cavernaquae]|nr:ATP-binding cassette domain-containing protein [Nocardioides cavernaquae]